MSDKDENQSSLVSVTIPSNAEFLKIVRRVIKTYFQAHPFPDEDIRHIVLAVDEACSNVIKYAYNLDETKKIRVSLSGVPNGIKISIRDYGVKADLDTIKPRDLDEVRPGGLGTHLMRSVMDEMDYDLSPEVGTCLTLIKRYPETGGIAT